MAHAPNVYRPLLAHWRRAYPKWEDYVARIDLEAERERDDVRAYRASLWRLRQLGRGVCLVGASARDLAVGLRAVGRAAELAARVGRIM